MMQNTSKSKKPSPIYLKDYRHPDYFIDQVDLTVDLHPQYAQVTTVMKVRVHQDNSDALQQPLPLVLQGEQQTLLSVQLNDLPLSVGEDYHLDETSLTVLLPPKQFILTITSRCAPQDNTSLTGLYLSNGRYCTQCEAHGFRRITYYLDRPDVMARFTTTVIADKKTCPVLLSNGDLIEKGDREDGRHYAVWSDPHLKPCYLFALVAGDLAVLEDTFTTKSGREVALKIYTEQENIDRCHFAMRALQKSMKWDEEVYGLEYDLDTYMIVAVNDFNMGAMENKGLNVFNAKYVLADQETATDTDFLDVETVIGHEYFHNWTGNRITLRDWFQLSLKEGLTVFRDQEFTADMSSRAVRRIEDVNIIQTAQFSEDEGPMAHPVRPASYIEMNNFYTVTVYNKGAEVIRMLQTLLGARGFMRGMELYVARHDGQAITTEEFVAAMEDANDVQLTSFRRWYSQSGTPTLHAFWQEKEDEQWVLTLKQTSPKSLDPKEEKLPFHIPVRLALYDPSGDVIKLTCVSEGLDGNEDTGVISLQDGEQKYVFENVPAGTIPSLCQGFSAPVRLESQHSIQERIHLLQHDKDPVNQWQAARYLALNTLTVLCKAKPHERAQIATSVQWFEAIQALLADPEKDPAFLSKLITLPQHDQVADFNGCYDIGAIHESLTCLRQSMATALAETLRARYESLTQPEFELSPQAMNKRALRNACLQLLSHQFTEEALALSQKQYEQCHNMTDCVGALKALVTLDKNETVSVLEDFFQRWSHVPLVVNKWFSLQAQSESGQTLARVKSLADSSVFDIRNPNNIYALLLCFAKNNPVNFHRADGAAYQFIARQIEVLDKINPQVAARLISAFFLWKKFPQSQQSQMKAQLEKIVAIEGLSDDVYELASKALN